MLQTAVSKQMVIFGHFNGNNKMLYNAFATDQSEPAGGATKKNNNTETTSELLKSLYPFQMGINTLPHTRI